MKAYWISVYKEVENQENLKNRKSKIPIGVSIGKNFDTPNSQAFKDYLFCMEKVYAYSNYIAINISSPNTSDLRELSKEEFLKICKAVLSLEDLDYGINRKPYLNFDQIHQFINDQLETFKTKRGDYLSEGITVSSFLPLRPIPFKICFILGMGEGLFPTPYHRDTLDLRHIPVKLKKEIQGHAFRERRLGDVSVTERDRYMFLETLVSTGKHLVMSYVSRNDRTDDELNPSSIIQTFSPAISLGGTFLNFSIRLIISSAPFLPSLVIEIKRS